jgi:DNA-binding transcriptional MerR regulator
MIVHEVATQTGVQPHVIRYYARIGLLNPGRNPDNGYRQFDGGDVRRLRLIKLAQEMGCTLNDIQEMLRAAEEGGLSGAWIEDRLSERLAATRKRRVELQCLEAAIERALARCRAAPIEATDLNALLRWMEAATDDRATH